MLVVRAVHTFVAEHADELEFQAGEDIEVLERDEAFGDGWWRVSRLEGSCLLVLCRRVRPVEVELTPAGAEYERRGRIVPGDVHLRGADLAPSPSS